MSQPAFRIYSRAFVTDYIAAAILSDGDRPN